MDRFTTPTYDLQYYPDKVIIYEHRTPVDYYTLALDALNGNLESSMQSYPQLNEFARTENNGFRPDVVNALTNIPRNRKKVFKDALLSVGWRDKYYNPCKDAHANVIKKAKDHHVALRNGMPIETEEMNILHAKSIAKTQTFLKEIVKARRYCL